MDEGKGEKKPRYSPYRCDPKYPPTGDPVCQSSNIDDLREYMFPRWKDENKTPLDRYTLTELGNRIYPVKHHLEIVGIEKFANILGEAAQGDGWYCKNTKCERLIATDTKIKSFGRETRVRLTCPHCGDHNYYRCDDYRWRKRGRR